MYLVHQICDVYCTSLFTFNIISLKFVKYRVSHFQLCNFERVLQKHYLRFFKFINGFIKLQYWRNFYQKLNTLSNTIRVRLHFFQSATFSKEWEKCINLNIQRDRTFFLKIDASKTGLTKIYSFWNISCLNFRKMVFFLNRIRQFNYYLCGTIFF